MQNKKSIRLSGETLFERFVIQTILLDSEVSIRISSGSMIKGFITGIDEHWIQITDSQKFTSKMIQISSVQEFLKTNKRISGLPKDQKDKMKAMTHALRNRCREVSSGAKQMSSRGTKGGN